MDRVRVSHNRYSPYLDSWRKRWFDLCVCAAVLWPALAVMLVVAVAVWLVEGAPVLLLQRRVGKGGRSFRMAKFRTMPLAVSTEPGQSVVDKSQISTLGKFLRWHRLDELPQLFNVLAGQMSLVGPRPELPHIVATYESRHRQRLSVKPGLTGLWQVMGDRGAAIHKEMKYDLFYLRKATIRWDIRILFLTMRFILRKNPGLNAHESGLRVDNISVSE